MAEARVPSFQKLVAWHVNSASDAVRRSSALRLKREHDLSLVEWRTLSLIEWMQPVRLRDVAAESVADKAQISRIVSGLVQRGLVERQAHATDARSADLSLTQAGRELAERLAQYARERDRALRGEIPDDALEQLLLTLAGIRERALALAKQEEARLGPAEEDPPAG